MRDLKKWLRYSLLGVLVFSYFACSEDDTSDVIEEAEVYIIKDKASFNIGAAVKTSYLDEDDYTTVLTTHFNQITAEYEMKMSSVWESESSYNWDNADDLTEFAAQNDLDVHGHVLVWYNAFPSWFQTADYDSTSFENLIEDYITTTVTRYKDDVISWDVTNEIFSDDGTLREDDYVYTMFNDPIAFYGRCFQYARDADADAKLFYNDYSISINDNKREAVISMVERFQKEGYPIDGLGDQFHYMLTTSETSIEEGLTEMAETGLLIHISELDIRVNTSQSDSYVFNTSQKEEQSDKYQVIVEMYEDIPDAQKFGITTWGVTDKYTWLTNYWSDLEYPLLFDSSYNPKDAYTGFLNGLD